MEQMRIVSRRGRSKEEGLSADLSEAAIITPKFRFKLLIISESMMSVGCLSSYILQQVVDEVYDEKAANAMGLSKGSICVMLHSGSRGLGMFSC